jgi:hypothetical protein
MYRQTAFVGFRAFWFLVESITYLFSEPWASSIPSLATIIPKDPDDFAVFLPPRIITEFAP